MSDIDKLSDIDMFFYYGKNPLTDETKSDVYQLVLQPERSMFYNRSFGGGVTSKENKSNGIGTQVLLRASIVSQLARRNNYVSAGGDYPDRRVATSQNIIGIDGNKNGELNVEVNYIEMTDLTKVENIQTRSLGV